MRWRGLRGPNAVVAIVALLVVAVACGESGESGDDITAPTTRPPAKELAERANLQIEDFPPEWRSNLVPPETVSAAEELARTVSACMNRPPPDELRETIAYSPDFSATDTRRASSSVAVLKEVGFAEADFVALRSDGALGCHKAQIDSEFRRQQPGVPYETTIQRTDFPQFGDETVAFRINATTTADDREIRTVIDEVYVRKGRVVLAAFFLNRTAAFPADLQRTLVGRMVGRA